MAKAKKETEATTAESKVVADAKQIALAVKCVCGVTGCGKLDAQTRVGLMGGEKVAKIAELEAAGKRKDAVKLLYS